MNKEEPSKALDTFLSKLKPNPFVAVGIDPGVTGAIGFVSGTQAMSISIPTLKVKTGNKNRSVFDYGSITEMFNTLRFYQKSNPFEVIVGLEQIPLSLGPGRKTAEILLNRAYAIWPLFLHSRKLRVQEVRPQVWKKYFSLLKKDKSASRMKAQQLFPKVNLNLKKDVDRSEALLIAEYIYQLNK